MLPALLGRRRVRRSQCADRDDSGSGALWLLCACALTWAMAVAFLIVGTAVVARHRAVAAADLAALGAAERLLRGHPRPCEAAALVVASQGGRLAECVVDTDSVRVVAEVRTDLARFELGPARAQARAGVGAVPDEAALVPLVGGGKL